jgi:hypothetical protein
MVSYDPEALAAVSNDIFGEGIKLNPATITDEQLVVVSLNCALNNPIVQPVRWRRVA